MNEYRLYDDDKSPFKNFDESVNIDSTYIDRAGDIERTQGDTELKAFEDYDDSDGN